MGWSEEGKGGEDRHYEEGLVRETENWIAGERDWKKEGEDGGEEWGWE